MVGGGAGPGPGSGAGAAPCSGGVAQVGRGLAARPSAVLWGLFALGSAAASDAVVTLNLAGACIARSSGLGNLCM